MNKHLSLLTFLFLLAVGACGNKDRGEKVDSATLAAIDDWSSRTCSCGELLGEESTSITAAQNCVDDIDKAYKGFKWPSSVMLDKASQVALAKVHDPGQKCRTRILNPHGM